MVKDIRTVAITLGYQILGNANFEDILEAGLEEAETLVELGILKLLPDSQGKLTQIECSSFIKRNYPTLNKPALDRRDDYYLIRKSEIIDKGYRRKEYVKPTYLFTQNKQPKKVIDILRKQNAIAFTTWKKVVDFERTNKSQVYDETWNWETEQKRQAVSMIQERANKTFYIAHQYDKRGRIYSTEYFLNYQADEWGKASISPIVSNEQLTLRGFRAMKIDLANHYGLDKASYSERLEAVENNTLPAEAKKSILAFKSKEALDRAYQTKATDYVCAIDATASGLQILAILANCEETAKLTNLTDISNCYDIYEVASKKILDTYPKDKLKLCVKDIRDIVKKALMTKGYNSEKQVKLAKLAIAQKGLYIDIDTLSNILDISSKISKAKDDMNNLLINTFSNLPREEQIIRYTMPDGFVVEFPNIIKQMKLMRFKGTKMYIKYDKLGWNKELNWRALSPNVVHSIDAYICRELIRRCNFTIITIHDSFSCHPNNIDTLRVNYLTILKEIQQMNILEYIGKQINPNFSYQPEGELFDIAIDKDSYALC